MRESLSAVIMRRQTILLERGLRLSDPQMFDPEIMHLQTLKNGYRTR